MISCLIIMRVIVINNIIIVVPAMCRRDDRIIIISEPFAIFKPQKLEYKIVTNKLKKQDVYIIHNNV